MSLRLLTTVRLIVLPVVIWAGFIAYAYSLDFFGEFISIPSEKSLVIGVLLAHNFLASAVVSVLFCYPLAFLYGRFAVATALAMSVPVLALRLPELIDFERHPYSVAVSAYDILAYAVLLIVGAWLAHHHLARSIIAVKRDAPQAACPLP